MSKVIFLLRPTIPTLLLGLLACSSPSSQPNNETTDTPAAVTTPADTTPTEATTTPAPVTPPDQPATGIDVSHFNGQVNWQAIRQAGLDFAYSKATQGTGYIDPRFIMNEQGSAKAGLLHGAYHFFVAADDPAQQAELFIRTVKDQDDGSLPPVLDLEQGGVSGQIHVKTFQAHVRTWLTTVEKALGVKPIIYTNTPFSNQYLNHPDFAGYDLWLAEYGVKSPRIPQTWAKKGWLIWQRTDARKIEGEIGTFDQDTLNGSLRLLTTLED